MLLNIVIVLLVGILISLAVGFVFFYQDRGRSKRVMYALGTRVTLAFILILVVLYGIYTGEFNLSTPWNP
jgi:hypothetical protein